VSGKTIKTSVMYPLVLAVVLLFGGAVLGAYLLEKGRLSGEVERQLANVEDLMAAQQEEDLQLVNAALVAIDQGGSFGPALQSKDRQALQDAAAPLFRRLQTEAAITHFYFTGADRVNILRLHKPDQYGDLIDRFTTVEAQRTGKPTQGIELGPLGTMTMRVVHPQFHEGRCIGFIELGHDLSHHIELFGETLDLEFRVLINKEFLDRKGWEAGMRAFGREGNWDLLPDFVVSHGFPEGMPEEDLALLATAGIEGPRVSISSQLGDRPCRLAYLPIADVAGQEMGRLVVIMDITDQQAASIRSVLSAALVCVAAGGLLVAFFFFYLGRIDRRLREAG